MKFFGIKIMRKVTKCILCIYIYILLYIYIYIIIHIYIMYKISLLKKRNYNFFKNKKLSNEK